MALQKLYIKSKNLPNKVFVQKQIQKIRVSENKKIYHAIPPYQRVCKRENIYTHFYDQLNKSKKAAQLEQKIHKKEK